MRGVLSHLKQHGAKWLAVLVFSIPAVCGWPDRNDNTSENRNLAPFPAKPHDWAGIKQYPAQLDLWVNDHLGLRSQLVKLNSQLRYQLLRQLPTQQAIIGKHGRLFLVTHNAAEMTYPAVALPCGYQSGPHDPDAHRQAVVKQLNLFGQSMDQHRIAARLLIAPSSPMVHNDDLPDWLQQLCARQAPSVEQAFAATDSASPATPAAGSSATQQAGKPVLSPIARSASFYPLQAMREAKATQSVYPPGWFHWGGNGARLAAWLSVEHFWQVDATRSLPLATVNERQPSDIGHLFPGVQLDSMVEMIDFARSGVSRCVGPGCFPELPLLDTLWGSARYRNPQAWPGRLVLLTDSFGLNIAPWYARYFQDVMQVSTNDIARLSPAERAQMRQLLLPEGPGHFALFIYHDGAIFANRIETDLKLLGLE